MGYGCKIIPMILLIVGASLNAAQKVNIDIEKVSGEDENQESEVPLILEKFRALLGLNKFERRRRGAFYNGGSGSGSPSPSPLPFPNEIEAPAPAPAPIHTHSYAAAPHRAPPPHKEERESNGGRAKRILVALVVSAGATSILSLIGIFWGCTKLRKQRRKSVKKVISDPAPDLFYLESLATALDPQPFCLKQDSEGVNTLCSNDPNTEKVLIIIRSDSENVDYSVESIKYEEEQVYFSSPTGEEVVIPLESHSSDDDESFHSLCNSHSSNLRLSNASVGSLLSDTSEMCSPVIVPKASPVFLTSTMLPPPPPPPPPPTKMTSKAFSSSTLANLSDSSSGSNQTPKSDLTLLPPPTPPNPPLGIPPPPFPKGPPPPPSQFPQPTPMGKDGIPLPKLKPLHWEAHSSLI